MKDLLNNNDIILKVNDVKVKNILHFEYLINKYDNIKLEVKRGNEIINLDFTK
jgi:S1-C subfamily serine protease